MDSGLGCWWKQLETVSRSGSYGVGPGGDPVPPGSRGGTATWVVSQVGVALKMGERRCWDGLRSDDFPRTRPLFPPPLSLWKLVLLR